MTHDSAVRTVVNLVPEIEKRGAAEVLVEFAHKEDLPPAQLEKLGQVYNTLRTVSHIDNADEADRGATVPLLDVPVMVVGYATGADREKAAAGPQSFSSHDTRYVDLNRALKLELSDGIQKAAADHDVTATPANVEAKFQGVVDRAAGEAMLLDLEVELESEMAKLAGEIIGAAPVDSDSVFLRDVSEFEEEALQRAPAAAIKAAGAYLEKYAAPLRIKLNRFAYDREIVKYAYEIPHAMGEKFAALAEAVGTLDVIVKLAAGDAATQAAVLREASPDSGVKSIFGDIKPLTPKEKPEEKDEAGKALAAAKEEGLVASTEGTGSKGQQREFSKEKDDDDKGDKGDKSSGGGGSTSAKGGPSTGSRIAGAVTAPFAALGAGIRGASQKVDETLAKVTTKDRTNKPQRDSDIDVEDIRRAMNLSRMIANDPVLKEADPKAILEVYNSVVRRNPEMAGDMASLKLLLREAVSYEGLTLDSQKMLSEIRRNSAQGEKEDIENDKKRYAVGGASPIQIAKA